MLLLLSLCDLHRKIVQFFWFQRKLQRYVPLNSVIPKFVAFIVVILWLHCLLFLPFLFFFFFFLHFSEETFASRRKKFSLATPGAFVFHIRSNYGIWADNRDLVNQSERWKCNIRGWEFNKNNLRRKDGDWSQVTTFDTMVIFCIPHISHSLMTVHNSSVGWDWTSACKGATGSRYQPIFWSHSQPNSRMIVKDRWIR